MKLEYRQAFTETYEIFKLMPQELLNKIPKKFYEMIAEERDKNYIANIKEPLEENKLKPETIIVLGLIYRDFLCEKSEKKRLQEKDIEELKRVTKELEETKKQEYNPEKIFEEKSIDTKTSESMIKKISMVKYKESFWMKIKNWFKNLFNKK